jgi:hypothetical protein
MMVPVLLAAGIASARRMLGGNSEAASVALPIWRKDRRERLREGFRIVSVLQHAARVGQDRIDIARSAHLLTDRCALYAVGD